jgi:hypothetical protein
MSDIFDLDALLRAETDWSAILFRGREWLFGGMQDLPLSVFDKAADGVFESGDATESMRESLANAVHPDQRDDFEQLDLTMRELNALTVAVFQVVQGADVGESEASQPSSDTDG